MGPIIASKSIILININHVLKFVYKLLPIAIIDDSVNINESHNTSPEVKILNELVVIPFQVSNILGNNSNINPPIIKKVKGKEDAVSIESLDNSTYLTFIIITTNSNNIDIAPTYIII